jgi:hypothetical protein
MLWTELRPYLHPTHVFFFFPLMSFLLFVYLFCSTRVWTQGLTLTRQAFYHLSHSINPVFCIGYFQDRVSKSICPVWPQTMILLISASWVARITVMNHWCPGRDWSLGGNDGLHEVTGWSLILSFSREKVSTEDTKGRLWFASQKRAVPRNWIY